jgi:LacI family transcriptional regulator
MKEDVVPTRSARATLATVAESAGVSVATVSKVLNGRHDVAPATRALVQELLQRHDYGRRTPAPGPAPSTRPTVELVFDGELNAYATQVMQGVLDAGAEAGVTVSLALRARGQRSAVAAHPVAWARELASAGRQAVIAVVGALTARHLGALSRARLPLVVIDPIDLPVAQVTSVGSTNFAGGLAATQHLLSLGHRRIGYVGGPVTATCNQARLHGFRAAMEAAGAQVSDDAVLTGHFVYQDGIDGGAALLDRPDPVTAVFAGCDEIATGVLEAARVRGLRVPQDLSVVGFDDTELARYASPPLTTVRQPLREMGGVALRTAMRLAAGERLDSHHVELATELVVRHSTAPPA